MVSGRGDSKGHLSSFDGIRENVEAMLRNRDGKVSDTTENEDTCATHVDYDLPTVYQLENDVLNIMNNATQDVKTLFSKSY